MKNKRVLITDKVHEVLIKGLEEIGFIVDYDTKVDNHRLDQIIHLYSGLVINSKIIMNEERINKSKDLLFIGRLGSGLEIIDQVYAKKKGIKVLNSPEGNRNAVAEHEIGMLLSLMNNLRTADIEVRNSIWNREKNRGVELRGKTIGIVGFGHTGSSFASKLSSWGLNLITYDKYKKRLPAEFRFVKRVEFDELIEQADIISIHLPLNAETKFMFNSSVFEKCKDGVIISNTSRGQIIKTESLINNLESGKIGGACLDVFENEKPETFSSSEKELYERLFTIENVVLSPHIAGWTHESLYLIASVLLEKIKKGILN
jgi:D-3-phosphoglycerate dehydrogenase